MHAARMQTDLFVVCDAATFCGGKVNILGAFDTIVAEEFPCVHDSVSVVARVRFSLEEQGRHTLDIHWIDADGQIIGAPDTEEFEIRFEGRATDVYSLIWNIRTQEFPNEADFSLVLRVDDQAIASIPLYVRGAR